MTCLEDLIGFCDLTPDEVHAIAEHEHIAEALAVVIWTSLLQSVRGPEQIRDMLVDELRTAVRLAPPSRPTLARACTDEIWLAGENSQDFRPVVRRSRQRHDNDSRAEPVTRAARTPST